MLCSGCRLWVAHGLSRVHIAALGGARVPTHPSAAVPRVRAVCALERRSRRQARLLARPQGYVLLCYHTRAIRTSTLAMPSGSYLPCRLDARATPSRSAATSCERATC